VTLTFLTPIGAVAAVAVVIPLVALALHERRLRRLRETLRLEQPSFRARLPSLLALASIPLLIALALTQPVLRSTRPQLVRTDAQAFYVFDISRSMLASSGPHGTTRIVRATDDALRMRTTLGEIPSGVASMTDRVLPIVFPTDDQEVYAAALAESVRIESPPPRGFERIGTLFESLDAFGGDNFFSPDMRHRVVVVFTDGESRPAYVPTIREALAGKPRTDFVIVRISRPGERIWHGVAADRAYRTDPYAPAMIAQILRVTHGQAFNEGQLSQATAAVRRDLGSGPVVRRGETLRVISLGRWIALAALVPLAFVLWHRSLV
jgi:hypothetical protein